MVTGHAMESLLSGLMSADDVKLALVDTVSFDLSHSARSPYVLVALSELLHHAATAVLMLPVLSSSSAAATFAMHRRPTTAAAAKNA